MMRAAVIVLSVALAVNAAEMDAMNTLIAKLQAERQRKEHLVNQFNAKEIVQLEEEALKEEKVDMTPESLLEKSEVQAESEAVLDKYRNTASEMMLAARNKLSAAEAMMKDADALATTVEGVMDEEQKAQLSKLNFESSFLEQEARKLAMRDRDATFMNQEIEKLEKQKRFLTQQLQVTAAQNSKKQKVLRHKSHAIKAQAEKQLAAAEKHWSTVEAVAQQNEAKPRHMAPKWMIEAQLQEAIDSSSDNAVKNSREKSELEMQKSYAWKQLGKKYTCSNEHDNMKAFILDSKQDAVNRADCLEKQLDKYCMNVLRAPAVAQEKALAFMTEKTECLPKGVDERVPEKNRASVAQKWCSVVEVLQGVVATPPKQKYFALLEDHIKVDSMNFEEVLKSFAHNYFHDWDLLQVDPLGKHNAADKMVAYEGHPVYRNSRNGQYFGFNSVLMKTASAPKILDVMMGMPAVPLDTLPTLLNELDGKIAAATLEADVVNVPKSSLIAKNSYAKCEATKTGLLELEQMQSQQIKPQALIQSNEPLDYFAFEKKMGAEMTNNFENHDLTDF